MRAREARLTVAAERAGQIVTRAVVETRRDRSCALVDVFVACFRVLPTLITLFWKRYFQPSVVYFHLYLKKKKTLT